MLYNALESIATLGECQDSGKGLRAIVGDYREFGIIG